MCGIALTSNRIVRRRGGEASEEKSAGGMKSQPPLFFQHLELLGIITLVLTVVWTIYLVVQGNSLHA